MQTDPEYKLSHHRRFISFLSKVEEIQQIGTSVLNGVYGEALQYHHSKSSSSTIVAAGSNPPLVANHRRKLHLVRFFGFLVTKRSFIRF
ncbi:hypothetical protein L1987_54376 [Smallanthus sonchifolius]|uniref:Uncharacterized protein n=1 Tax=Smallanthus sonchifolius TaxID=185202 RepID=A0ACB9E6K7_9ASTR|nr:hypothetical protein L1987_54376 [Smallanthus sonchifolius]